MSSSAKPIVAAVQPVATSALVSNSSDEGKARGSYGQILKSSVLIGGSSFINIGIGIVRTKAVALMLGPAGFGLIGIFNSLLDMALALVGLGINSSGVRQIAHAAGTGEKDRIAHTVVLLRRSSLVLGVLGAVLMLVFSAPIAEMTFGDKQYAGAVSLLSVALLFRQVSSGQNALLQGMRRIPDVAKNAVFGGLIGTVGTIVLIYFYREKGVVPSIVFVAAATLLCSWWYARKVAITAPVELSRSETRRELTGLFKLGFAFMASAFMMMGAAYIIRLIVLKKIGFEGAGLYQSAWALGGLYVGFVLQAMGADFYPRLTAIANDDSAGNLLVNEQTHVSLLLAGPGVLATLTFAPLVVAVFYAGSFNAAVPILRWICLGMAMRVITWPIGYIVLAKGKQSVFFWTEAAYTLVHLAVAWTFVEWLGLNGAGIGFFASYVFHAFLIYPIVRKLSGFRWSPENKRRGMLFLASIAAVFVAFEVLPFWIAATFGTLVTLVSCITSTIGLARIVPMEKLPAPFKLLLRFFPAALIVKT